MRTKEVKRIVRDPHVTYAGQHQGETIALGDDLAVAYVTDEGGVPHVLTVLYKGIEFVRPEKEK